MGYSSRSRPSSNRAGFKEVNILLKDVYSLPSAPRLLFERLKNRTPTEAISHASVPEFNAHMAFFESRPYRYWYLVEIDSVIAGTLYITDENSIGVSLDAQYAETTSCVIRNAIEGHTPLPAVPSKRVSQFSINVSPGNEQLAKAVTELGGVHVQNTYIFK